MCVLLCDMCGMYVDAHSADRPSVCPAPGGPGQGICDHIHEKLDATQTGKDGVGVALEELIL